MPEDVPPSGTRRRIRVTGGQLQRDALDPGLAPPTSASPSPSISNAGPEGERRPLTLGLVSLPGEPPGAGPAPGPAATDRLPLEITGFFRHLHDTAQALSQQIGQLTTSRPGPSPLPPDEARPLPRHQRRPQRVGADRVNAKRSARFSPPGEVAAPAALSLVPAAPAVTEGETVDLPALESTPVDASGAADPSVPLPASVHDLSSGAALPAPFQPRHDYAAFGESAFAPSAGPGRSWVALGMAFALGLLGGWVLLRTFSAGGVRSVTGAAGARSDQANAHPATARPPANPASVARANVLVNQALRAEKSGDVSRAVDLFTEAEKTCPDFPGIRYRLALLALRQGEKNRSRVLLGRSLDAGEEVAAVHNLQSALARLENQTQTGFAELEAATRSDPFNPKYYYFWAEALRRVGRLPEAAERLEDALVRTADPTDESLYQFKLRMVKIELNRDNEFARDLAASVQGTNPAPPEWLLTAAAVAIKRGDYAGAAAGMERARRLLSPAVAAFLLNDQTFRDNAWRPELAPLYAAPLVTSGPPTTTPAPVVPTPSPKANPTPAAGR